MKAQDLYDELEMHGLMWGRINETDIYIWTDGYKHMHHYEVADFANKCGFSFLDEKYVREIGKTQLILRQRKVG